MLHPKCISDKQTFEQEGWHYELEEPGEDITFKGVVFNEMKGVYSSPDSVLGRECQQVRCATASAPPRLPTPGGSANSGAEGGDGVGVFTKRLYDRLWESPERRTRMSPTEPPE